jgi:hypothetical protein
MAHKPLTGRQPRAVDLAARKGHHETTIAVANKLARIVWAVRAPIIRVRWPRSVKLTTISRCRRGRRLHRELDTA